MKSELAFRQQLQGTPILELLRSAYYEGGELVDEANVLFASNGPHRWYRFGFEAGIFFWKNVEHPSIPGTYGGMAWTLERVAHIGSLIETVAFTGSHGAPERSLSIRFLCGEGLTLSSHDDTSALARWSRPPV